MEFRFAEQDLNRHDLMLLIPTCLRATKFAGKRDLLKERILKAGKEYVCPSDGKFETELNLWMDIWWALLQFLQGSNPTLLKHDENIIIMYLTWLLVTQGFCSVDLRWYRFFMV